MANLCKKTTPKTKKRFGSRDIALTIVSLAFSTLAMFFTFLHLALHIGGIYLVGFAISFPALAAAISTASMYWSQK